MKLTASAVWSIATVWEFLGTLSIFLGDNLDNFSDRSFKHSLELFTVVVGEPVLLNSSERSTWTRGLTPQPIC